MTDTKSYYVIRYEDGAYNLSDGYPVKLYDATRYSTREEAEEQSEGLCGVECIEEVYEEDREYEDSEILEFLLNQFKSHSLKMNGVSDWVFINTGFPMNHAKGRTARDAVIAAMRLQKKNES